MRLRLTFNETQHQDFNQDQFHGASYGGGGGGAGGGGVGGGGSFQRSRQPQGVYGGNGDDGGGGCKEDELGSEHGELPRQVIDANDEGKADRSARAKPGMTKRFPCLTKMDVADVSGCCWNPCQPFATVRTRVAAVVYLLDPYGSFASLFQHMKACVLLLP